MNPAVLAHKGMEDGQDHSLVFCCLNYVSKHRKKTVHWLEINEINYGMSTQWSTMQFQKRTRNLCVLIGKGFEDMLINKKSSHRRKYICICKKKLWKDISEAGKNGCS